MKNTTRWTTTITFSLIALAPSLLLEAIPLTSEARTSRNEYDIQYPQHPIRFKIETKDLPQINPKITIQCKISDQSTQSVWTTPWDLVGAIGTLITIYSYTSGDPYAALVQGSLSVCAPIVPRIINYIKGEDNKSKKAFSNE